MSIFSKKCPNCTSKKYKVQYHYKTKNHGTRAILTCHNSGCSFSETTNTFLYNLKKPISTIWQAINNRTEGLGFNATARVCGISKNTLLDWENRFTNLYHVLFLYSLTHCFLQLVIEGDELYTKVKKMYLPINLPAGQ